MKSSGKHFEASKWMERLVPLILVLLVLGLLLALLVVVLSITGLTPGV